MSDFDVVIVGGGIAGASLGSQIAHRRRTLIIEAEQYCGYHSTGRSAAFWLESYGGPTVGLLTAASHDFLHNPPADFVDRSLLRRRGALHVSRDGWPELPAAVEHRRVERSELERVIPGIRPEWRFAAFEPGCADIDVDALHAGYLRLFRRLDGEISTSARLASARYADGRWATHPREWLDADGVRAGRCGRRLGRSCRRSLRRSPAWDQAQAANDGATANRTDRPSRPAAGQ